MICQMLFCVVLQTAVGAPSADEVWIRAGRAHLGDGRMVERPVIHVRDGLIVAVVSDGAVPPGARVLDYPDGVVVPGFVDGATDAGLPDGSAQNEEGRECTPSLSVSQAVNTRHAGFHRYSRNGTTSMVILPGNRNVFGGLSCLAHVRPFGTPVALSEETAALRITLGTEPVQRGGRGGGSPLFNRRPQSRMGTVFEVRNLLAKAQRYGERKAAGDPLPFSADLETVLQAMSGDLTTVWSARTEKDIRSALRLAEEFGIRRNVLVNAEEADRCAPELAKADWGVLVAPLYDPQYARSGRRAPEGAPDDDSEGHEEHANEGKLGHEHDHDHDHATVCLVGCVEDHEHVTCGEPSHVHDETWPTCLGHDCCLTEGLSLPPDVEVHVPVFAVMKLRSAGVRCAFSGGGHQIGATLLDGARMAVRSGLPVSDALQMLTLDGARLVGVGDLTGSLEPGKQADLVIFSGDPFAPTSAIRLVMSDGHVVNPATSELKP